MKLTSTYCYHPSNDLSYPLICSDCREIVGHFTEKYSKIRVLPQFPKEYKLSSCLNSFHLLMSFRDLCSKKLHTKQVQSMTFQAEIKKKFSLSYIALKASDCRHSLLGSCLTNLYTSYSTRPLAEASKARFQVLTWKYRNNAERSLSVVFTKHVLNPVGRIAVLDILPTQQPQCFNITRWSLHIFAGIIHR